MQRTRFSEPEVLSSNYREKRHSFSNDRTLNPSISGGEQDSLCSTQEIHDIHNLNRRFTELSDGDSHKEAAAFKQSVVSKTTNIAKVSRLTPSKASATPKKWSEPLKNRASVGTVEDSLSKTCIPSMNGNFLGSDILVSFVFPGAWFTDSKEIDLNNSPGIIAISNRRPCNSKIPVQA